MTTVNQAKKTAKALLDDEGVFYDRVSAKTISFEDLARGNTVCVQVFGVTIPDPRLARVRDQLPKGVMIEFQGPIT